MAQLRYANQSGTVYVYESISEWDPVKKQSRSKRKCIGKIDPETGEIIPTGKRGRKPSKGGKTPGDAAGENPSQSPEVTALEKKYTRLESDYQKLLEKNEAISRENRKMKALLLRFQKEASGIIGE